MRFFKRRLQTPQNNPIPSSSRTTKQRGKLRGFFQGGGILLAAIGLLGIVLFERPHTVALQLQQSAFNRLSDFLAQHGVVVRHVYLSGQHATSHETLLDALQIRLGQPLWSVDMQAMRQRLQQISWVEHASISRWLPDTLSVTIVERTPIAVWQHEGKLKLIDSNEQVFIPENMHPYRHYVILVGEDAPAHAQELIHLLDHHPILKPLVKAAVWVGERRWNLKLENGVTIKLPEKNIDHALTQLLHKHEKQPLLQHPLQVIDLRIPGRIYISEKK